MANLDVPPPSVDAGPKRLAQWLFEQSLLGELRESKAVAELVEQRNDDAVYATLLMIESPVQFEYPSEATVRAGESIGVTIRESDFGDRGIQVRTVRSGSTWTLCCELHEAVASAGEGMLKVPMLWPTHHVERLLKSASRFECWGEHWTDPDPFVTIVENTCRVWHDNTATDKMVVGLTYIRDRVDGWSLTKADRDTVDRISRLLRDLPEWRVESRDGWGLAVLDDSATVPVNEEAAWQALVQHAAKCRGTKPTRKWLKDAKPLLEALDADDFVTRVCRWFDFLRTHRSDGKPAAIVDRNDELLCGLAWFTGLIPTDERLPPALQVLAEAAHAKVPGRGRRAVHAGNGAIWSLMQWPPDVAAGRLQAIADNVKSRQTKTFIGNRLGELAAKLGKSRDELEEASLPDLGFERGRREAVLGGHKVRLIASQPRATDVAITFENERGRAVKTAPAALRRDHAPELKTLKSDAKDASRLLAATRRRLESSTLEDRSWTLRELGDRFFNHGLVGPLARRLIWDVDGLPVTFDTEGDALDVEGKRPKVSRDGLATLWHPIGRTSDEVLRWRERLADLEITQPFKQAHREVYVLTDAERQTESYSNRFAAHLIRQTQFRALAETRGWRADYIGSWDGSGYVPPTLKIERRNLRAEFWVDFAETGGFNGVGPSGGAMYLSTDQVRFYEGSDRQPIALASVPPVVLSEVLRDCDLFVAVASVGNDPTWLDGGEFDRYEDYWHNFSFGDLGQTAETRKAVLEKLIPRLKIAERCSFSDKFLVVRGDVRTYKIHLGSGNILMEPNDQYLCIVPDRRAEAATEKSYLPFEGDRTMSVIVSKALLLADDSKITDSTIISQIR
ncbi:MAG: DUF4132 domain-containing protein [Planctomycetota bacterium]